MSVHHWYYIDGTVTVPHYTVLHVKAAFTLQVNMLEQFRTCAFTLQETSQNAHFSVTLWLRRIISKFKRVVYFADIFAELFGTP